MKYFLDISLLSCFALALLLAPQFLHAKDQYDIIVSKSGDGDFEYIQDAIDAAKAFPDERITIFIKNGIYREKVKVHSWNTKLSLIGESKAETIITFDDHFNKINRGRNSTFHTYTLLVDANDFYAENLTIENTAGDIGQAVALHVEGDRVQFHNCIFKGNQDTLYVAGEGFRQYFSNCDIEGTTDFIFGEATAIFESCQIHSKKNSYITAASTPEGIPFGFIFKNCKLTAEPEISKVFLGRPWRNHAKTVFIHTEMGGHIAPEGWHNWNKEDAESTALYAEYDNSGEGNKPGDRVKWSFQLNEHEVNQYQLQNVFGDWQPLKIIQNQISK